MVILELVMIRTSISFYYFDYDISLTARCDVEIRSGELEQLVCSFVKAPGRRAGTKFAAYSGLLQLLTVKYINIILILYG
jgi:hypothetical protein